MIWTDLVARLFGDARAAGARRVLTFGPLGSNHALATAIYGQQLGFEVHLQLWPEPFTERVGQTLMAEQALLSRRLSAGEGADDALALWPKLGLMTTATAAQVPDLDAAQVRALRPAVETER